jgi:hypothetical protein
MKEDLIGNLAQMLKPMRNNPFEKVPYRPLEKKGKKNKKSPEKK